MHRYNRMNPIDYDSRMTTLLNSYDWQGLVHFTESWSRFCEQYPHNAELLRLLFGQHAKSAHFEYSVIPEKRLDFVGL